MPEPSRDLFERLGHSLPPFQLHTPRVAQPESLWRWICSPEPNRGSSTVRFQPPQTLH